MANMAVVTPVQKRRITMKKDPGYKPPKKTELDPHTVEEEIRCCALELYEQRGREHGRDLEDWLRAEEEIVQTKARGIAA